MVERDKCVKFFFFLHISEWLPKSFRSPLAKVNNVISLTCKGCVEMLDKNILAPFQFLRGINTFIFSLTYGKGTIHILRHKAQKLNLTKAKSIYREYNQKSSSQKKFPFVFPLIILLQTLVCML